MQEEHGLALALLDVVHAGAEHIGIPGLERKS